MFWIANSHLLTMQKDREKAHPGGRDAVEHGRRRSGRLLKDAIIRLGSQLFDAQPTRFALLGGTHRLAWRGLSRL